MNDISVGSREVLSPFLPGTSLQYAWDSTSLGMLKTCPRLYQYVMIDGWSPKDDNIHLKFGGDYHSSLEEYARLRAQGQDHAEAMRGAVLKALTLTFGWEPDEDTKAGKYKNRRTLVQMVIDYLDKFKDDPAETVILDNGQPAVELSFRFELDFGPNIYKQEDPDSCMLTKVDSGQPYMLSGHLDRVVSFQDSLFVMDRKTATQTLSDYYFIQFEPNNQMTLYTLASQITLKADVKGVIIDAAQVMLTEPHRFVRRFTFRTPGQLEEWVRDLKLLLRENETYAELGYWPMRDTSCDKFGGCKFREICNKDPHVRGTFLKGKFNQLPPQDRWNPLKPR